MQVRVNETRQIRETSGTFDGVNIGILLAHNTANTAVAVGDFKPDGVSIKVLLKRNGAQHILMQDNLLILGTFNTLTKGYHEFLEGETIIPKAASVKENVLRSVCLKFGGPVRLSGNDEILVEITANSACVSANIDQTISYVDFNLNRTIGYEIGLFQTVSEVVVTNASQQTFQPGDNVTAMAFLNFDKSDLASQVLANVSIGSDKLDDTFTFTQLVQRRSSEFGSIGRKRYGTSLPIGSPTVLEGLPFLPQSFLLYNGKADRNDLDGVRVGASFNMANVASSQNFFVYQRYTTDQATIAAAIERKSKHTSENMEKLPVATALSASAK